MNKSLISASVIDQTIQLVNCPLIASGGVDEIKIDFDFCSLWDGCGKTAVFYRDPEAVYHVPIVDGTVTVPHEVLAEAGFFYFGVMGVATNIRTTEVLRVKVVQGAITEATNVPDVPSPDIYQQLLAAYGETQEALAVERARIDELAAMRGSNGENHYAATIDGKHVVNINSNGTGALLSVQIAAIPSGYDCTFEDIPLELAPVSPGLALGSDGVRVVFGVSNGKVVLRILSTAASNSTAVYVGSYPLASPYIEELGDIRTDAFGEIHKTAGGAVRSQITKLDGKKAEIDDTTFGSDAWSSQKIVETLCPALAESGSVISCEPLEGYPLEIVTTNEGLSVSELTLTLCGKNLFDFTTGAYQIDYAYSDGATRTYFGYAVRLPVGTYTIHAKPIVSDTLDYIYGVVCDANNIFKSNCKLVTGAQLDTHTINVADGDVIYIYKGGAGTSVTTANITFEKFNVQIEAGSVATPYEPYNCVTHYVDFSGISEPFGAGAYYEWNTGICVDEIGGWWQETTKGVFVEVDKETYIPDKNHFPIIAPAGVKNIFSSVGVTSVKGKKDPTALFEKLTNAFLALGANI